VSESVLDASALICLLRNEPGADRVQAALPTSYISAVNLSESYATMVRYGKGFEDATYLIARLRLRVVSFDAEQARIAAALWEQTRSAGLSLGDRACLALAISLGARAVTAERAWTKCGLHVRVELIR
jgi:PIN domain nuclease of toxin-antitoxin system